MNTIEQVRGAFRYNGVVFGELIDAVNAARADGFTHFKAPEIFDHIKNDWASFNRYWDDINAEELVHVGSPRLWEGN